MKERDMIGFIGNHIPMLFGAMIVLFATVLITLSVEDALGHR